MTPTIATQISNVPILASDMLEKINAYWRAANYLSVGYLMPIGRLL